MTPEQYCQDKAAKSGSSFYYSFLFLPEERRRAIIAVYALCREIDDVADECTEINVAYAKLAWWRAEISAAFQDKAQHPVTKALTPVIKRYNLAEEQFSEIIDGMEMDLQLNRYPTFKALQLYCYRVASVVGQISAEIFGYQSRDTLKYAYDLGIALQLTNIIRDVGEDARRNRIYLPLDELHQYGVQESDVLNGNETENFRRLMDFQAARAQSYYDRAFSELPKIDRKAQRAGLVMAAIYQTLLHEIQAEDYKVLHQRTSLTPLRKLWIAWKAWLKA